MKSPAGSLAAACRGESRKHRGGQQVSAPPRLHKHKQKHTHNYSPPRSRPPAPGNPTRCAEQVFPKGGGGVRPGPWRHSEPNQPLILILSQGVFVWRLVFFLGWGVTQTILRSLRKNTRAPPCRGFGSCARLPASKSSKRTRLILSRFYRRTCFTVLVPVKEKQQKRQKKESGREKEKWLILGSGFDA